jgi:WD40 repeat protein
MRYDAFLSYSHAADGKLAPALQRALHRFAKPWNRMRALRSFRDATSLAATPELWPTIVAALQESNHFLLLASPQAASSKWVQREVEWWLANRAADKILVLLTAGTIVWNEDARDFDWKLTTALPDLMRGKFRSEPLYVDLTWAQQQDQLSLRNTRFRSAILDIAAPLHGKDKDQLDGEDVRQFRRTGRLRATAVASLIVLALATTTAAVIAFKQRNFAVAQARVALSRQLAAEAVAGDTRLDVAILLAVASYRLNETPQARAALLRLLLRTPTVKGVLASDRREKVVFSPDGRLLASAPSSFDLADSEVVYLWSIDTLRRVGEFRPAEKHQSAQAIAFHPDGKSIAVGYLDGAILLWDVTRREPVGAPFKATLGADNLAFSPDGRYLLSASYDGVKLWDAESRQLSSNRVPQFTSGVREVMFGPDGTMAAAVTDKSVTIWDIKTGQIVSTPRSIGDQPVTAFAFHPNRRSWLFGTSKGVFVYEPKTRKVERELGHPMPLFEPTTLQASADGNTIMIEGGAGVKIFDPERDQALGVSQDLAEIKSGDPASFSLAPDGRLLAQSLDDGAIVLWDLRQSRTLGEAFDGKIPSRLMALLGPGMTKSPSFVLWDTATRRQSGAPITTGHGDITTLVFSPNNRILATGGRDGAIALWDIENRQLAGEPLRPTGDAVYHLAFSPDGKLLASANSLGIVTLWDVARRQAVSRPFGESPAFDGTLAFSPDGRFLMSAGFDKISLYDIEHQKLEAELIHRDKFIDSQFSLDGRQVLSLTKTSLVTWDIASRRRLDQPMNVPAGSADTLFRLSPDGKFLALLSLDGLRLFDVATRQPIGEVMTGSSGLIPPQERGQIGFSTDGKQFVMKGVFSPDGNWLVSRENVSPFVWHIDVERWQAQACAMVNRNLTKEEWRRYTGAEDSYVGSCLRHEKAP